MHISPGKNFLACGFWDPNPNDLKRIRQEFDFDAKEFRDIISAKEFFSIWGNLEGSELKTAPRNFDKNHPDIDLIRKKQFIFSKKYTDKQVQSDGFILDVVDSFKAIRPYFDYMSSVLTTNLNGESIL